MKKIILIDGGPRKNMNTASLADAFADGIRESGNIEVKRVRLYDLKYRGCMSCLACKLKGRSSRICLFPHDVFYSKKEKRHYVFRDCIFEKKALHYSILILKTINPAAISVHRISGQPGKASR